MRGTRGASWIRAAGLLALALASQGCLEVREEIHVREDGSARYVLDVAVLQEAVALGDARGPRSGEEPRDLGPEFRALAETTRARSRDVSEISGFDATESLDSCGYRHFRVQLDVADAEDLGRVHQDLFANLDPTFTSSRRQVEKRTSDLQVEELSDDNLGVLRSLPSDGLLGMNDEAGRLLVQALGQSTLAGRELVLVVDGPVIVSANGRIAEDRRSVEFHVPLAQILAGTAMPQDLRAEVRVPRSRWPWIAVGLVVALVAGLGAVSWMRRHEPEIWRS